MKMLLGIVGELALILSYQPKQYQVYCYNKRVLASIWFWKTATDFSILIKNFKKRVFNPLNVECFGVSFHCLLCTESQATDIPRTLR